MVISKWKDSCWCSSLCNSCSWLPKHTFNYFT